MRAGRFDRQIYVDLPDIRERKEIFEVHLRPIKTSEKLDLDFLARQTPGFSGADIANVCNEAALIAARKEKKAVTKQDFLDAVDRIVGGLEKKNKIITPGEKKTIAYHEVGHAISGHFTKNCEPVHKISIISRGMALGVTWFLPREDKHLYSKAKFEDEICSLMGGTLAEKIIFNEVSTGASSDLQRATQIARQIVTDYGMSSLGPIIFGETQGSQYLGIELSRSKNYSEETAAKIDKEIENILKTNYKKTEEILIKHKKLLEKVAKELLKKETLSEKQFKKLLEDSKI
jgi:cell division protease FtsH